MPCYDPDDHHHVSEIHEVQKKLCVRTDMLCQVLRLVEARYGLNFLTNDIRAWWEEHKKFDKEQGR